MSAAPGGLPPSGGAGAPWYAVHPMLIHLYWLIAFALGIGFGYMLAGVWP